MTVIVTGGAGFIGSHVVGALLARGFSFGDELKAPLARKLTAGVKPSAFLRI